jgi:gamma-glutamyltranspeptidase/glutathione hydrolase
MKASLTLQTLTLMLATLLWSSCSTHEDQGITGLISEKAMVVSAHPLASEVGKSILEKGGNAVDAAIAVHFALAVVYPEAGNIGGGGFFVIRQNDASYHSLDFRERGPLNSHPDMYLDENGEVIDRLSLKGHLASGVPGAVDGMVKAYQKFGSLAWEDLVQPSIELAANGFVLTEDEANKFNRATELFQRYSTVDPVQFTGKSWEAGDTLVQSELAETLTQIRDHQREGFYAGPVADYIVEEMQRGGGIIRHEDLASYESTWRQPLIGEYKGHKIITMGPPSSGGLIILQMLGTMKNFDVSNEGDRYADYLHLKTEMERRVYADRAAYMADSDYYPVPIEDLLNEEYLKERFLSFNPERATPSAEVQEGNLLSMSEETTHFSVVDPMGNAVACTTTLNGGMGSSVVVSGAGFVLNNEMDDFSIKPGHPNMFGVLGGEANKVEPGKRMLSSMTPTILEKDGDLYMVVGTPGGSTIPTSVFQTIVNVIEFGMGMQEAVNEKRFHSQWQPEVISYEKGALTGNIQEILEAKGHELSERNSIGRVDAILRLPDGRWEAGADPRGMDAAAGF